MAEEYAPSELDDDEANRKLHYALYLRRYYLQLDRVEWDRVEWAMSTIDRVLDNYNDARRSVTA